MPTLDLAHQYLEIFFSGKNLNRLYDLFSEDLQFDGPLLKCTTARDYIESLKASPAKNCTYEILHVFEKGAFVNIIYHFSKPGITTLMSQLFEIHENKITSIKLIFDTHPFRQGQL